MDITKDMIGRLVRYYQSGWYHGRIEAIHRNGTVSIRPTKRYCAATPRLVTVNKDDVELEDDNETRL